MIFLVFGFTDAEARKISMISQNKGDLFRYLSFHLAQSVPAGVLFASSTSSISLISKSALLEKGKARECETKAMSYKIGLRNYKGLTICRRHLQNRKLVQGFSYCSRVGRSTSVG